LALEDEIQAVSASENADDQSGTFLCRYADDRPATREIITQVQVSPFAAKTGSVYLKVPQPARDLPVGVAALVTVDAKGHTKVRVGITGAAAKAYRAYDTEAARRENHRTKRY
jgi:CO/xanthine dehydrogenase FAD-binding subunit